MKKKLFLFAIVIATSFSFYQSSSAQVVVIDVGGCYSYEADALSGCERSGTDCVRTPKGC